MEKRVQKKTTGSGQRTRSSRPLDFGSSSSVYLARDMGPRLRVMPHCLQEGSALWAAKDLPPLAWGIPGTVSDAEPGTECTKPSKRLPLLLRSKDCETVKFCSSCEAGRQASACGRPSAEFCLVSGTHRQAPSGNLVVRVRYRALPP